MSQPIDRTVPPADAPVTEVRHLLAAADRRLLGDTIAVGDEGWRAATALPDWTRGHVATHIARHADAIARLSDWAATGVEQAMYPQDRDTEIAAGAGRSGLDIQTDLDTSADRLADGFDRVAGAGAWDRVVRLRDGSEAPAALLPPARLFEVIIHHLDLQLGLTVDDIDARTAEWCLQWAVFRQSGRSGYPTVRLTTDSGAVITINADDDRAVDVQGPVNLLLGWLTRRSGTEGLHGDLAELPSFG